MSLITLSGWLIWVLNAGTVCILLRLLYLSIKNKREEIRADRAWGAALANSGKCTTRADLLLDGWGTLIDLFYSVFPHTEQEYIEFENALSDYSVRVRFLNDDARFHNMQASAYCILYEIRNRNNDNSV